MLRKGCLGLLFLLLLCLSGCWDVQEVSNRGIANAVFFDSGASKKIKMGVSLAVPGSQVPPNVGAIQQFLKRNFTIAGEGDSVDDAWSQVQSNSSRDIFFGQTRVIILSEKVAHRNINDILEFIGRVPLVPPNTNVLITKDDPVQLLDEKNQNNDVPGNYVDFFFRSPFKRSLAIPVDLWRVNAILDQKTGDPYIPVIETSQKMYKIAGTAVFSRTRFAGELTMNETQTLALIKGTDVGYQTVPLGLNQYAAFKNIGSHTRITPRQDPKGTLTFDIQTKIQGVLVENVPHREIRPEQKREIEKRAQAFFQRKMAQLVAKLQAFGSDPAQFGDQYRIAYPRRWPGIDWHQIYAAAKFKINARFVVKETGIFR